ncbi:hypothetical protein C8R45DRAFT_67867 [Mycena sanguinolenta]|nr:hypothetical protein C8R45DRAFT_67867 [Mycena sanguinolenta]
MARSTSTRPSSKPEASSSNTTCEHCGVTVKRPTDLPRHLLLHAANKEEFMYTCPVDGCSHQTLQRSNLNTHIRTHTRTRPYECPEYSPRGQKCLFTTADPSSLHRHRKRKHGYKSRSIASDGPVASGSGTREKSVESNASFESEESFGLQPAAEDANHGAASSQPTTTNTSYSFIHVPYVSLGKAPQSHYESSYPPFDLKGLPWLSLSESPATSRPIGFDGDDGTVLAPSAGLWYHSPSVSEVSEVAISQWPMSQALDSFYDHSDYFLVPQIPQTGSYSSTSTYPPASSSSEFQQEYEALFGAEFCVRHGLPTDFFPHCCKTWQRGTRNH